VTPDTAAQAEAGLARLDEVARRFGLPDLLADGPVVAVPDDPRVDADAVERFRQQMDDDLDTAGALAGIFDLARRANADADAGAHATAERGAMTVGLLCAALGVGLRGAVDGGVDEAAAELVRRRDAARAARDFGLADQLRDELVGSGWLVEDGPEGTRIRRP
jgi:cysteinyl-tRNA synthetase